MERGCSSTRAVAEVDDRLGGRENSVSVAVANEDVFLAESYDIWTAISCGVTHEAQVTIEAPTESSVVLRSRRARHRRHRTSRCHCLWDHPQIWQCRVVRCFECQPDSGCACQPARSRHCSQNSVALDRFTRSHSPPFCSFSHVTDGVHNNTEISAVRHQPSGHLQMLVFTSNSLQRSQAGTTTSVLPAGGCRVCTSSDDLRFPGPFLSCPRHDQLKGRRRNPLALLSRRTRCDCLQRVRRGYHSSIQAADRNTAVSSTDRAIMLPIHISVHQPGRPLLWLHATHH